MLTSRAMRTVLAKALNCWLNWDPENGLQDVLDHWTRRKYPVSHSQSDGLFRASEHEGKSQDEAKVCHSRVLPLAPFSRRRSRDPNQADGRYSTRIAN